MIRKKDDVGNDIFKAIENISEEEWDKAVRAVENREKQAALRMAETLRREAEKKDVTGKR